MSAWLDSFLHFVERNVLETTHYVKDLLSGLHLGSLFLNINILNGLPNLSTHHDFLSGDLVTPSSFHVHILLTFPECLWPYDFLSLQCPILYSLLSKCDHPLSSLCPGKFSFPLQTQLISEVSWSYYIQDIEISIGTTFFFWGAVDS